MLRALSILIVSLFAVTPVLPTEPAIAKDKMTIKMSPEYIRLKKGQSPTGEKQNKAAVSNIMKTKHDTVKNSISNIR